MYGRGIETNNETQIFGDERFIPPNHDGAGRNQKHMKYQLCMISHPNTVPNNLQLSKRDPRNAQVAPLASSLG